MLPAAPPWTRRFNSGFFLLPDVAGSGTVRISGNTVVLTGDNSAFNGLWDIRGVAWLDSAHANELGSGTVFLNGANSWLDLYDNVSVFSNALTGNGVLIAEMAQNSDQFGFASSAGSAFSGTVWLQRGTLALDATAAAVLGQASVRVSQNGVLLLSAPRSLGGLTLDNGTLQFAPSNTTLPLSVNTLDATAGGTLAAQLPSSETVPVIPSQPRFF